MKHLNCFHVLRTSTPEIYTSSPLVDPDALAETCQPALGRFPLTPPDPSSWVCGFNRPIWWDIASSHSAAYSRVFDRLPIPLFARLKTGVVLKMVDLLLTVCNDQEATHRKHCGSTLYSAGLGWKYSYWWSYLPYMVLSAYNRASWKVWMYSSSWSIAILCLQPEKSSPVRQCTLFVVREPLECFPGEFGESLSCLVSTSLHAPVIWNCGPWEGWTAS